MALPHEDRSLRANNGSEAIQKRKPPNGGCDQHSETKHINKILRQHLRKTRNYFSLTHI